MCLDNNVLLISGFGENGLHGGLFYYDGTVVKTIDYLPTTGLHYTNGTLVRLLRTRNGDKKGEIIKYTQDEFYYYRIVSLIDGHDVLMEGNHMVAVSTGTNDIIWMDEHGNVSKSWHAPGEADSWHLNCLNIVDNKLHVSAFGRFKKHRGWHGSTKAGLIFQLDDNKVIPVIEKLECPHTPRFIDNQWILCDSRNAQVLFIDPGTKSQISVKTKGWARGLAFTKESIFIGQSSMRKTLAQTASVAVCCKNKKIITGEINIPCHEIYDLAVIPVERLDDIAKGFNRKRVITNF